ncbi:MAG: gfo/Idh/MocA family oxidoreductase, partial [Flavobacteriaceae bacterium]
MKTATSFIDRRKFIKGTTAILALSSLGAYGFEATYRDKPWRVGLIGCGWYGTSDLFKLIQVAEVDVISVCDVDSNFMESTASQVAERQKSKKKPKMYGDYKKMLGESKLDIVLIGSPDHW